MHLFVCAVPPLRARLVASAGSWLNDRGSVLAFQVMSQLVDVVVAHFDASDYSFSDELFRTVEEVLTHGTPEAQDIVATGFLEGMQHQSRLPAALWEPLLGAKAREYCRAWDRFTGVRTNEPGEAS